MIDLKIKDKLSLTSRKHIFNAFGCCDFEKYDTFIEFYDGRKFIGTMICKNDLDDEIYIDKFVINQKYRGKGFGIEAINRLKSKYRYISTESTIDALGFWRKCGFSKLRDQRNRIYTNTIDMHYQRGRK